MSKCPHCGKTANPVRLCLNANRSYSCVSCKKRSQFDRPTISAAAAVAMIGAVAASAVFRAEFQSDWLALLGAVIGGSVALVGANHFLFRLWRTKE